MAPQSDRYLVLGCHHCGARDHGVAGFEFHHGQTCPVCRLGRVRVVELVHFGRALDAPVTPIAAARPRLRLVDRRGSDAA